ncbi:hypothetical protein MTsDn1_10600 [Alteromonas sp. MTD1]
MGKLIGLYTKGKIMKSVVVKYLTSASTRSFAFLKQKTSSNKPPNAKQSSVSASASVLLFAALSSSLLTPLLSSQAFADEAVLAGGCFWCMEADFEKLEGVTDVVSGFTGGTAPDPTYNGNHKGHYEAVKITYDGDKLSYKDILDHYWVNIDPFDDRGQFCDKGPSYLSAIFVANAEERKIAEATKRAVVERFPDKTVVTPILPASTFYPIKGKEIGHQDFYKKSPVRYKFYRWNCGRDQRLEEIWGPKTKG